MLSTTTLITLLPFLSLVNAITITAPAAGTTIDPTQPITIAWTSTSSDPTSLDLKIDNADPNSLSTNQIVASNIATSAGSFVVPANTIQNFGTGYQVQILGSSGSQNGAVLGTVGGLVLGAGNNAVTSGANGQSFVTTKTSASYPAALTQNASGASGSGTSSVPAALTQTASGSDVPSATVSVQGTETSSTASGFVTSQATRSASVSETSSGTASAASATGSNTASALRVGGSGEVLVMGMLGVLAGLVAVVA